MSRGAVIADAAEIPRTHNPFPRAAIYGVGGEAVPVAVHSLAARSGVPGMVGLVVVGAAGVCWRGVVLGRSWVGARRLLG